MKDEYCAIDIETTGVELTENEIIEISIVKVRNHKVVDAFTRLVKPTKPLRKLIIDITNITNEMLEYAEDIRVVLPEAIKFIGDNTIVSHNAKFDMNFIKYYCNKLGITLENEVIDTLTFPQKIFPDLKSSRLSKFYERLSIEQDTQPECVSNSIYATMYLYEYYQKHNSVGSEF